MRIRRISNAFEEIFSDFKDLETDYAIFSDTFSVNAEEVPQKYQMELIVLQSTVFLKLYIFENVDIKIFYQYIGPT